MSLIVNENTEPPLNLVSTQSWLRPSLIQLLRNRDHQHLVDDLKKFDHYKEAKIHFPANLTLYLLKIVNMMTH